MAARDELREGETMSEHFLQPQPYRADYHPDLSWPKEGPIPCENHVVLLHSDAVDPLRREES